MTLIVVPTPLTTQNNFDNEERIIISKKGGIQARNITIEGVTFVKSEFLGVGAKVNSIKCLSCGEILRSIYHYHTVYCSCGKCKIDGGEYELIRDCKGPFKELSKFY